MMHKILDDTKKVFLTPKQNVIEDKVRYTRNPVGRNKIAIFMKGVITGTILEITGKLQLKKNT